MLWKHQDEYHWIKIIVFKILQWIWHLFFGVCRLWVTQKINSFHQNSLIVNKVCCLATDIVATANIYLFTYLFLFLSGGDHESRLPWSFSVQLWKIRSASQDVPAMLSHHLLQAVYFLPGKMFPYLSHIYFRDSTFRCSCRQITSFWEKKPILSDNMTVETTDSSVCKAVNDSLWIK